MATATKFEIRTAGPNGSLWGFSRTLDAAKKRAEKLSRKIRTDVPVVVVADGQVVATTTTGGLVGSQRTVQDA